MAYESIEPCSITNTIFMQSINSSRCYRICSGPCKYLKTNWEYLNFVIWMKILLDRNKSLNNHYHGFSISSLTPLVLGCSRCNCFGIGFLHSTTHMDPEHTPADQIRQQSCAQRSRGAPQELIPFLYVFLFIPAQCWVCFCLFIHRFELIHDENYSHIISISDDCTRLIIHDKKELAYMYTYRSGNNRKRKEHSDRMEMWKSMSRAVCINTHDVFNSCEFLNLYMYWQFCCFYNLFDALQMRKCGLKCVPETRRTVLEYVLVCWYIDAI